MSSSIERAAFFENHDLQLLARCLLAVYEQGGQCSKIVYAARNQARKMCENNDDAPVCGLLSLFLI